MFKRVYCYLHGRHDWEGIQSDCFKPEYKLPYVCGRVCMRCGKIDLTTKGKRTLTRKERAGNRFGYYLKRKYSAYNVIGGQPPRPLPWEMPKRRIPPKEILEETKSKQ